MRTPAPLIRLRSTGLVASVAALAAVAAGCSSGGADAVADYPTRNLQITVPYAPGGGTDIYARTMATGLERELGKSVVIINQEGGGGTVGTAKSASAKPDGYQLGVAIDSNLVLQPNLVDGVGYTYQDFSSIGFGTIPFVLVAATDAPFDNLEELAAAGQDDPGALRISTPGDGSANDMAARAFGLAADADFTMVPFSGGGADAVNAVLSGDVELASTTVPVVKGLVEGGKLKIIGVLADEPAPGAPDASTLADAGIPSDLIPDVAIFLDVPKGASNTVVSRLEEAVEAMTGSDEFQKTAGDLGYVVAYEDAEESAQDLKRRSEVYNQILEKSPQLKVAG
jgi:tripartite-type tricarboxylate transporter receptor subunit TctC